MMEGLFLGDLAVPLWLITLSAQPQTTEFTFCFGQRQAHCIPLRLNMSNSDVAISFLQFVRGKQDTEREEFRGVSRYNCLAPTQWFEGVTELGYGSLDVSVDLKGISLCRINKIAWLNAKSFEK